MESFMTPEHIRSSETPPPNGAVGSNDFTATPPGPPVPARAPAARTAKAAKPATAAKAEEQEGSKDGFRELVETVVFVVVLVLILKAFLAEAFVIPTGSMATTLLGYHKTVVCPECGYRFDVNCSKEVDLQEEHRAPVVGCTCPNCRVRIDLERNTRPPGNGGGGGFRP
jgi:DNA-directed RNA polymerase subunit RPC12/RpoP